MAPLDDFRTELTALVELALQALINAFRGADWTSRESLLATMREPYRDIVGVFGEQAAWSAVRYLEQDREEAGMFDLFPEPAGSVVDSATDDQIDGSLGWTTEPTDDNLEVDSEITRTKMSGAVLRMIRQPARQTVWNATQAAGTRYARQPRPDACEWCLMLASRGAVYARDTVVSVTARSERPEGARFHDFCACVPVEVRVDDDLPEINRRLEDLWIEHGGSFDQWREYLAENPFSTGGTSDGGVQSATA